MGVGSTLITSRNLGGNPNGLGKETQKQTNRIEANTNGIKTTNEKRETCANCKSKKYEREDYLAEERQTLTKTKRGQKPGQTGE